MATPHSQTLILLDTMVVGGMFAVSKPDTNSERENKSAWMLSIKNLVEKANILSYQFAVPTSVCFELMTMNKSWDSFVNHDTSGIFQYAKYSITPDILQKAAEYSYTSRIKFGDNTSYKVKSFDPITAAYSLTFGFPIITENQKDFCESHFKIAAVEPVVLNAQINKERRLISILIPKAI